MKTFLAMMLTAAVLTAASCRNAGSETAPVADAAPGISEILSDVRAENPWEAHLDSAPDGGCVKLRLGWTGPLRREFNDSNHVHLEAARSVGFDPIRSERDILHLRRPVTRIESCADFYLEPLTHSFPYLVPEASELLHEIGRRFNNALAERGGGSYRIKVTSLLRTPVTVKRLSRVNRNSTSESTHSYGTTFDISYSKFICDSDSDTHRSFEDLKNLLGEVLHDLRSEGRCYVKYEVKQSCFHITVRPLT